MFYVFDLKRFFKFIKVIFIWGVLLFSLFTLVTTIFPAKHLETIDKYCEKYNLDKAMVCAIIYVESGFNENATSNKGASGLMQIMETTANWAAGEIDIENYDYKRIYETDVNISIGCWYLARLMNQYNGSTELALAAYNGGSGNVRKWLDNEKYSKDGVSLSHIPYKETREYVKKIERYTKVYEIILKVRLYEN